VDVNGDVIEPVSNGIVDETGARIEKEH